MTTRRWIVPRYRQRIAGIEREAGQPALVPEAVADRLISAGQVTAVEAERTGELDAALDEAGTALEEALEEQSPEALRDEIDSVLEEDNGNEMRELLARLSDEPVSGTKAQWRTRLEDIRDGLGE